MVSCGIAGVFVCLLREEAGPVADTTVSNSLVSPRALQNPPRRKECSPEEEIASMECLYCRSLLSNMERAKDQKISREIFD